MRHERTSDSDAPPRYVDGDGVELPEEGVDRIARRTHADEADDHAADLCNGPIESRVRQISSPASLTLGTLLERAKEVPEACIPRLHVDPGDCLGVLMHRPSDLGHGPSLPLPGEARCAGAAEVLMSHHQAVARKTRAEAEDVSPSMTCSYTSTRGRPGAPND
jgi:hypothetical protein